MYALLSRLLKAGVLLLALTAAAAAEYPDKQIRLIIPFPPGGSNDVVGRLVARHLSDALGQQVYVDNRGGAGGTIGTDIAAKAAPDGYTLLVISLAHAVNPWLYTLPYDHAKAFVPVASFGSGTNVLAVNPDLPVHSVKELIALAKAKPGELNYASAGVGSFQHLGGELFKLLASVNIVHVPFRGGGPAMIDVMGGHTKIVFSSLIQTTPHVKSGQLRALATGGAKRNPVLPDVPTIAEAGVPGYEANNWWGMLGARRYAAGDRRETEQSGFDRARRTRTATAIRQGRRLGGEDDARRIRQIHRGGNGQVGPRRQGRPHYGPVTARLSCP